MVRSLSAFAGGALALVAACAPQAVSHGGPVRDHVSLVDNLRARGLQVDPASSSKFDLVRVAGTVLKLSGDSLQQEAEVISFNYDDKDLGTDGVRAAQEDASRISADGTSAMGLQGAVRVYYAGTPHLFRRERVIVLYVGDDQALLRMLTELLGPQFAGR